MCFSQVRNSLRLSQRSSKAQDVKAAYKRLLVLASEQASGSPASIYNQVPNSAGCGAVPNRSSRSLALGPWPSYACNMSDPRLRPVLPVDTLNAPPSASQPQIQPINTPYTGIRAEVFDRIAADQRLPGGARYVTGPQRVLSEEAGRAAEEGPSEVMPSRSAARSLGGSTRPTHPPAPHRQPPGSGYYVVARRMDPPALRNGVAGLGHKSRRRMQTPPTLPLAAPLPATNRPPRIAHPALLSPSTTRLPQLSRRKRPIFPPMRLRPTRTLCSGTAL